MKTNLKLKLVIFSLGIFSMSQWACTDKDDFAPDPGSDKTQAEFDYGKAKTALKDLNTQEYVFEFDPKIDYEYTFPDRSRISFNANSFVLNGQPITCATVKAVVKKVLVKKDMVANGVGTNSNNQILESKGMFHTEIFCDGKSVDLKPGAKYQIQIPGDLSSLHPQLDLFYGEETATGVNWIEADKDPNTQTNVFGSEWQVDSTRLTEGFACFPEKLKWVNCDYFLKFENIERTEPCLEAIFDPLGDMVTLQAFCVFKNFNVVLSPCCEKNDYNICFAPLPIGEKVVYILIGKGKTNYYLGYVEKNIEKDELVKIKCEVKTQQEVKDFISGL